MVVKMAQAINIQKYHLEENDFRFGWSDFDLPFMSSSTVGVFSIVTSDVLALLPCRRNDGVWRFGVTMALVLKKLEISLKGGRIQMVTHTHGKRYRSVLTPKKGNEGKQYLNDDLFLDFKFTARLDQRVGRASQMQSYMAEYLM
jgi:hypothetical protein